MPKIKPISRRRPSNIKKNQTQKTSNSTPKRTVETTKTQSKSPTQRTSSLPYNFPTTIKDTEVHVKTPPASSLRSSGDGSSPTSPQGTKRTAENISTTTTTTTTQPQKRARTEPSSSDSPSRASFADANLGSEQIEAARKLLAEKDYPAAKEAFNDILKTAEISRIEKSQSYKGLGDICLQQGQFAEASMAYEKALDKAKGLNPEWKFLLCKCLTDAYLEFKSYAAATQTLARSLRIPNIPNNQRVDTYIVLNSIYFLQKQYNSGIQIIEECLEIDDFTNTQKFSLYYSLGLELIKEGKLAKAIKALEKAANTDEISDFGKYKTSMWIGKTLYKQKNYTEAEKMFKEALDIPQITSDKPKIGNYIFLQLSKIYSALDKPAKAMAYNIIALSYAQSLSDDYKYKSKTINRCNAYGSHENIAQKLGEFLANENDPETKNELWRAMHSLSQLNIK